MLNKKNKDAVEFVVLAVDVVCFRIINKKLNILIGKTLKSSPFPDSWALIGGLVKPTETSDQAVFRLLDEKAGIKDIFIEQLHTFSSIDRDPRGRVVSVAYNALTFKDPQDIAKAKIETKWIPVENIPKLAYDHNHILKESLKRLVINVKSTDYIKYLVPDEFTLSDLQSSYEAVVGDSVDKRNFRKRILSLGIIKKIKFKKKEGVMRPASLFVFC